MGSDVIPVIPASDSEPLPRAEFERLWFGDWGFSRTGTPEDAAVYLSAVLHAVEVNDPDNTVIGGNDGQQDFMFQWLKAVGLVDVELPECARLTQKGKRVLRTIETGLHYPAFGL